MNKMMMVSATKGGSLGEMEDVKDFYDLGVGECARPRTVKESRKKNGKKKAKRTLIAVGFEPTPSRTSALSWRLRPLGHAILSL